MADHERRELAARAAQGDLAAARRLVRVLEREGAAEASPDSTIFELALLAEAKGIPRKTVLCVLMNGLGQARPARVMHGWQDPARAAGETGQGYENRVWRLFREVCTSSNVKAKVLASFSELELSRLPGIGPTSIAYARHLLELAGLALDGDDVALRGDEAALFA